MRIDAYTTALNKFTDRVNFLKHLEVKAALYLCLSTPV
jgi:hypothetical protein